jgi:hypothetical protein
MAKWGGKAQAPLRRLMLRLLRQSSVPASNEKTPRCPFKWADPIAQEQPLAAAPVAGFGLFAAASEWVGLAGAASAVAKTLLSILPGATSLVSRAASGVEAAASGRAVVASLPGAAASASTAGPSLTGLPASGRTVAVSLPGMKASVRTAALSLGGLPASRPGVGAASLAGGT